MSPQKEGKKQNLTGKYTECFTNRAITITNMLLCFPAEIAQMNAYIYIYIYS